LSARLPLDQVTLCCIDCVNVPLAVQAMRRSLDACAFSKALLFTSQPVADAGEGIEVVQIPPIRSKREYSIFLVKKMPEYVKTDHALIVQWDGYVTRPDAWDPAFLDCDYIGAPWPPDLSPNPVGNGGFSLRSRKLMDALLDPSFPEDAIVHEDQAICVHFRPRLESEFGIRFAPVDVAGRFSHETVHSGRPTFGFHGPQNLWMYWNGQDIDLFLRTVSRSALKAPEVVWLARHLYNAERVEDASRVAAASLVEQPGNSEILDILANVRDRLKPHDYKARSEQRFLLGLLKRHLPDFFRHRQVLEITRPGQGAVTQEWFDQCRFTVPNAGGAGTADTLEAFSASGGSFDTVVSCETLEHLPHWRDAFENAVRMLKANGLMFVGCAGYGRRQHESERYPSAAGNDPAYYRNLAPEDFAGIDFESHFRFWTFLEDRTVHDLYFVGLGRGASEEHAATLRRLLADSGFLLKRKNVFGLF
jgi:SAM-dependent methyltransferase